CRCTRSHDLCPDKPVALLYGLALAPLLDHRAKHIGKMFIKRARFIRINQVSGVRNHTMSQLMANHIHRFREADKDLSISIAVAHLLTGPESVVIPSPEMHA